MADYASWRYLLDWWLVQEIRLRSRWRASGAGVKNILRTVSQLQASARQEAEGAGAGVDVSNVLLVFR